MTIELYWLTWTALLTAVMWLPYVLDRLIVRGFWPSVANRTAETGQPHSVWAQRALAAHRNAAENLVVFATAVLIAREVHVSTPLTQTAAMVYFWTRVAHYLIYAAGVPLLRTLAFAVGVGAQMVILLSILGFI